MFVAHRVPRAPLLQGRVSSSTWFVPSLPLPLSPTDQRKELGRDYADGKYAGISAESLPIGFRPGNNTVYYAQSTPDSRL